MSRRAKSFSEILSQQCLWPQYLWPKRGDRLLRATDDRDKAVTFSSRAFDRHVHIWSGYMRAGAALVEEAEREAVDRHFLVYPILFNYRHGLELAIKWIIERYGGYVSLTLDRTDLNHDLWSLWTLCKKVFIEIEGSEVVSDGTFKAVEQIVKDFHDLDKTGIGFRYSNNKDGLTIKLPDTPIDLGNVKNVMEAVDNYFSGVDGYLGDMDYSLYAV